MPLYGQYDTSGKVKQLHKELESSTNYSILENYFCSDLHIGCGCYKNGPIHFSKKHLLESIKFSCNGIVKFSYAFKLFFKTGNTIVYDRLTKKKMKLKEWDKSIIRGYQ